MAKQETYTTPLIVFIVFICAAFAGICVYRFVFPLAAAEPVEILGKFSFFWYLSGGIITFINLFPALAFSALVIPFGLKEHSEGGYAGNTFVGKKGFSVVFLKYLTWPVIAASTAAAMYGVLFFLVLPITMNARISMINRSDLYAQARGRAQALAADKDWKEAARFLALCQGIWPGDDKIEKLKADITSALGDSGQIPEPPRSAENADGTVPVWLGIPGNPVNSSDALSLAEKAFAAEQFYDAHWLATLAQRLAKPGAAETAAATALASQSWEKIANLEPNAQEKERFALYRMKRDGYEAMVAGDWISAFYTFQELAGRTPEDPDVTRYLENCRAGITNVAFFIDELDLAIGSTLNAPVFSLPSENGGRLALRFASLAVQPDHAYAWGPEIVAAAEDGTFRYRVSADYAKLVPLAGSNFSGNRGSSLEDSGIESTGGKTGIAGKTVLLLRALDRTNKEQRYNPVWVPGEKALPDPVIGTFQILLNLNYDDFLLLAKMRRGIDTLNLRELFIAEKRFEAYGYAGRSFRAAILCRLGDAVFFLPMAVLALILGWRYRAQKKPRYVYVPMLGILPLVFYGAVLFYRNILGSLSVWFSLSIGLSAAMIFLCAGAGLCFILALVLLAAQHG
ncbi:hypothetical protein AGMMS50230_04100 [Spirochaetia bacterium]|nr:hypothetical protein AGMMS50230_04100 [Spirochaetia bacterium]